MWFCSLYSGSSGNCLYVGTPKTNILIDAGLSGKKIVSSLKEIGIPPESIDALLITHEHGDHIKGAGIISRMFNIPIFANNNTWEAMAKSIGKVKEENIKVINVDKGFTIGDIDILPYSIPHDAIEPVGYCLGNKGKKISIATDIGHVNEYMINKIQGSNFMLLEANHDVEMLKFGPYPYPLKRRVLSDIGHLSNDDAGKAILNLFKDKPLNVMLGHLSKQNNYPELAYETVVSFLKQNCINIGKDVNLDLASRDSISNFIEV